MSVIKVTNVSKKYQLYNSNMDRLKEVFLFKKMHRDFYALNGISFEISEGEIVGIVGRNGSGKSTILKLISNVTLPSSGSIEVTKKVVALLELGAGFNPELSGIENIYLYGLLNGVSKNEMKKKINSIIEFAEIGDFINQPIKTYSSGMKSRLAFAVSIHVEPEILIIDEVLAVGDAAFQRKCFAKIEEFKNSGITILFVSHSASQIIELCDRAIWLQNGEKILDGDAVKVMGLYQKYFDKKVNRESILTEYSNLSKNKKKRNKKSVVDLSYFNKNLIPKTTIQYEINGAEIYDVAVLNSKNEKVNLLERNEVYFYTYKVKFYEDFKNVNFAMMIKTIKGFELGGINFPIANKGKIEIKAGEELTIKYRFKNILNPGVYFFNCGVNTLVDNKKVVLNRILDAYMIDVIKKEKIVESSLINFNLEFDFE